MSNKNSKSSQHILNLVPHIVEDYCLLQNSSLQQPQDNISDIKLSKNGHSVKVSNIRRPVNKSKKRCLVRKIHIEIVPDCAQNSEIKPKSTCSSKSKKSIKTFAEKSLKSTGESNKAQESLENLSTLRKRKEFDNYYIDFMKRKSQDSEKETFFQRLSIPKSTQSAPINCPWMLTESMKNFKPSARLLELAKYPMCRGLLQSSLSENLKVKPSALLYNATPRILELAYPKTPLDNADLPDPFKVSPKALTATLSQRVRFLSYPKTRRDYNNRKHPFKVKRSALHAKPSKLIKQLAMPRLRNSR